MNRAVACLPEPSRTARRICIRPAVAADREEIYRRRHEVYARELGQHALNPAGALRDPLDEFNHYLVARDGDALAGFVSITPPGGGKYSLDKYLPRSEWPVPATDGLYEVRLLTVAPAYRSTLVGPLLMYAALCWVERQGGEHLIAIGRREVLSLYLRAGLAPHGRSFTAGAVQYELLSASVAALRAQSKEFVRHLLRMQPKVRWEIDAPLLPAEAVASTPPAPPAPDSVSESVPGSFPVCYHGGAFFEQIGEDFTTLDRRHNVINADVLDAWFPPAPEVLNILRAHLDWALRTSPPTECGGLIRAISSARRVPPECVVPGGGSSDLIFRCLTRWLTPRSRVLLLDPTYGEYWHVLRRVIGCRVETQDLSPDDGYRVDPARLASQLREDFDLVCLVNPNNPTGQHLPRAVLQDLIDRAPGNTRFWNDEAYLDYVGAAESLEPFACGRPNVIVCKSMSKGYALSGARVGYLCAAPPVARELRAVTPPWVVGLPAQLAAVVALRNPDYYRAQYASTNCLRESLGDALRELGLQVFPGVANFLLCRSRADQPDAATLVSRCRAAGVFIRDTASMTNRSDGRTFRIAVKEAAAHPRIIEALRQALAAP